MQLNDYNEKKLPVQLKDCDIQLNPYSKSLEVLIKGYTKITQSKTNFEIEDPNTIGSKTISLSQLPDTEQYDKVNVTVKILEVGSPLTVNTGKQKQDIVIADSSGTATLTVWEKDIDKFKMLESYSIQRLIVRIFNETHYLSLPETAVVTHIDDIEGVSKVIDAPPEPQLENAQICGVKEFKLNLSCSTGKVIPVSSTIGECQKCCMKMKMLHCKQEKSMAKFIVNGYAEEATSSNTFVTLVAYGTLLNSITESVEITTESLLNSRPSNVIYNDYYVIKSISRD